MNPVSFVPAPSHAPDAMPPVLSAEAMRAADAFTIDTYGIPGFTLMESAGRVATSRIAERYGPFGDQPVVILCGKGNNGGDGLMVARQLLARGARVVVINLYPDDALRDDPARNLRLLQQWAERAGSDRLDLVSFEAMDAFAGAMAGLQPALFVDAMLGTGLTSALREPIRSVVEWLNARSAPTVALDMPTGLHSDTGAVLGAAVAADCTITMGALKAGLLLGEGPRVSGAIDVAEIGIPPFALDTAAKRHPGCARYTTDAAVRKTLPMRRHDAHKYSVGMAVVVGGAPEYTGAPAMAARAAARIGAGYVACAGPPAVQQALAGALPEIPTITLPAGNDGLNPQPAIDALEDALQKARALLVGPGLGRTPATQQFVRMLLQSTDRPAVIDADGLNALAGHLDALRDHARGRWILTPHAGEFERLAGPDADLSDRIHTARSYAQRWNSVLLLKGMPSLVGTPEGTVYINSTGNPALAVAGTGDVLAGFCAGLLAQGMTPAQAAVSALHIGGAAADRYAAHYTARSMQAPDLIDQIPHVLRERFS